MQFIKKVTQRLLDMSTAARLAKEDGLINTTDLLVATAATVVLAAGVGGTVLSTLDESKYGKAQPDAQAVGQAIVEFYTDTGKWPGQAEHALTANQTKNLLLLTGTSADVYNYPAVANKGLNHTDLVSGATCGANSGQGFVNGTIGSAQYSSDGTTVQLDSGSSNTVYYNLNDYLVRQPNATDYPNWDGPYVQEISDDPWDRAWVAYLAPLYCSENVATSASGAGNIGFAWLISGGTNRTITTPMTNSNLDPLGDDTGVNFGKLTVEN